MIAPKFSFFVAVALAMASTVSAIPSRHSTEIYARGFEDGLQFFAARDAQAVPPSSNPIPAPPAAGGPASSNPASTKHAAKKPLSGTDNIDFTQLPPATRKAVLRAAFQYGINHLNMESAADVSHHALTPTHPSKTGQNPPSPNKPSTGVPPVAAAQ